MNLPAINTAKLPDNYKDACKALAECTRIDECKEWSNRAMAMASYAKQSKDEYLMNHAIKIKARAIRRCGELLKQVEPNHTGRIREGDHPNSNTRKQVAEDAGLSEHQRKQYLNVANVPEETFTHMVDEEHATITELAKAGRDALSRPKPAGFKEATQAIGYLRRMVADSEKHYANKFIGGMNEKEVQEMKERAIFMIAWLNDLIIDLEE